MWYTKIGEDMKKLKIYLDTSVISYLQADDAPERMAVTQKLWRELQRGPFEVMLSGIVAAEVDACPEPKRTFLKERLGEIVFGMAEVTDEIIELAEAYLRSKIIPRRYRDDALHIATATINGCNAIISWNFRHMVRLQTIIGVNGLNKGMGYGEIEILSPESVIDEEE
jgi:predicted nucleic acid-binding protein